MKNFVFVLFLLLLTCTKKEVLVKEEKKILEDLGKLSTYGPIVYIEGSSISNFILHFYTEKSEKSKITIFRPENDIIVDEKTSNNFHYFDLKKVNELTVFQIFSSEEILNKKIIKITIPHKTPYKFAIFGGYIENEENYKKLANFIGNHLPVFTIHTGDFVKNRKNLTQWTYFINNSSDFLVNTVFIPVFSKETKNSEIMDKLFKNLNTYKTYNYPSLKLIVIDTSQEIKAGSPQYEYLENELKNAGLEWKVVAIGENPFQNVSDETIYNINKYLIPLFEKYKVNLVITPGKKGFERYVKNNITYIATSCNEKPIKSIDTKHLIKSFENEENYIICETLQKRLLFKVYNIKNEIIDEFQIIE